MIRYTLRMIMAIIFCAAAVMILRCPSASAEEATQIKDKRFPYTLRYEFEKSTGTSFDAATPEQRDAFFERWVDTQKAIEKERKMRLESAAEAEEQRFKAKKALEDKLKARQKERNRIAKAKAKADRERQKELRKKKKEMEKKRKALYKKTHR